VTAIKVGLRALPLRGVPSYVAPSTESAASHK